MEKQAIPRRDFLKRSVGFAMPALFAAAPFSLNAAESGSGNSSKLRIVCVGGHPDDPESGCAGTLARYADLGHSVTIIYLTRGERGIRDKSLDEAAKIRTAEAEAACKIIGAQALFFGQIDGATELNSAHVGGMAKLLSAQKPNLVFAHWPIDTHMDHQVASILTIRACMNIRPQPQLYFFEVNSGSQSQGFTPNTYVDISRVVDKKKKALFAHVSQDGEAIWRQHHEIIATWRGREAGVAAAEAFAYLNRENQSSKLPGL